MDAGILYMTVTNYTIAVIFWRYDPVRYREKGAQHRERLETLFSARCNIYMSRLCYDVSVRLSVTELHWVAVHAGNTVAASASEVEAIIRSLKIMAAADGGIISRYASHC